MRILIFSMEYPPIVGGGGSYAETLVSSILKNYPQSDIAVLTSGAVDSIEENDVVIYRRKSCRDAYENSLLSAKLIDDYKDVVDKFNPDIIHAFHTIPILAVQSTKEIVGAPFVLTQHRTPEPNWMPIKLDGKGVLAELGYAQSKDSRWIAPSNFFKNNLLRHSIPANNINVIHPAINNEHFKYTDFSIANKNLRKDLSISGCRKIITIPVVDRPRKDIRFCLDAVNMLKNKDSISILITGVVQGSDSFKQFNQEYPDLHIVSHGAISKDRIRKIIAGSDAIVMCSIYEGFGISAIEALASGVRTLIRQSPGLEEIIAVINEAEGFTTVEELSKLISNFVNFDNDERKEQSRQTSFEFSQKMQADNHMSVYNEVIDKYDKTPTMQALKNEFDKVFGHKASGMAGVYSIFVSGSVAKNDFISGWSDIDIACLCENDVPSLVLDKIKLLQINLRQRYSCKVGVDYISANYLSNLTAKSVIEQYEVPNLILFHEQNTEQISRGILYIKKGYSLPILSNNQFTYKSLDQYKEMCRGLVYESIFRSDDSAPEMVKVLRIATKTCVYLLRTNTLQETGKFIQSYDEVIESYADKLDVSILKKVYATVRRDTKLDKSELQSLTDETLKCFNSIIDYL